MRPGTRHIPLLLLLSLAGCMSRYTPPETPMPPSTILLSQMLRELSAQPGFNEALLHELDSNAAGKKGPALMTPALVTELRKRILGNDWQGLDRFPGWTMREINPTVRVAGHFAGKDQKLEDTSSVHPGAPVSSSPGPQSPPSNDAAKYLDLGPYALDKADTISLDKPSTLPGFTTDGIVTPLGAGVTRGDGPNNLAPEHAESQRLADMLNRLAANKLDGAQLFTTALISTKPNTWERALEGRPMDSPQELISALVTFGHTVTVIDARYFANFGHFHYQRAGEANTQDVMMPFFVNTRIAVPGTGGPLRIGARPLLIPVSHAEYEWSIRGPLLNADVAYYFGIDGKSEWRTMDTLDQSWVLKRAAHTYTGEQAVEVTRLAGLLTVAYMHQHAARPTLPFGGYYALGVCQDGVSAIEKKLTGKVTLFPNTADDVLFTDPRDSEVNAMIAAIPKDRSGALPEPARIFGSLPTVPDGAAHFTAITIPGLADDLNATNAAWQNGKLHHTRGRGFYVAASVISLGLLGLIFFASKHRRRR